MLKRTGARLLRAFVFRSCWAHGLSTIAVAGRDAFCHKAQRLVGLAEIAYRRAAQDRPDSNTDIAFNNLVQVLTDQKRVAEALVFAKQTVDLGAQQAVARDTLRRVD